MPFKSAKQRRAMYAAASGNSTTGITPKAAKKFISHSDTQMNNKGRKPKTKRR